jgi:CRISPR-associated endonuclease/helicase Cas3
MGTWDPSATEKVSDLGDQAQWMFGRMVTLRLDSDLLPPGAPAPPGPATELSEFDDTTNVATWLDEVQTWMEASPGVPLWFSDTVGRLRGRPQITIVPAGYLVLHQPGGRDSQLFDGSDEANQFTGTGVTLRDHMESVGRRVHGYASRLGLPEQLAADLELAGRWHDIGKLDPRFQLMLVGGDEVRQARLNEPLAKSLPGTRRLRTPYQWHDILGVALLASHKEVISLASDPDLVLHLIGTHHGFGRPLHTPRVDPTPCIVAVDGTSLNTSTALGETSISLEMADRFWRLVNRYGHYGLAWLEALLRLADHRESEDGRV